MRESLVAPTTHPWWLLPPGRVHPAWWIGVCLVVIWSDFLGGAEYFPLLYTVPVVLAAWYSGARPAMWLAGVVPLIRLAFLNELVHPAEAFWSAGLMTAARGVVVFFIGLWFARLADVERALDQRVRVLEGLLPICSFCKNIRNENGEWERIENFISRRSDVEFSHGFCPSCGAAHYGSDAAVPSQAQG